MTLTVFWDMKEPIIIDFFEKGATINSAFYFQIILKNSPYFLNSSDIYRQKQRKTELPRMHQVPIQITHSSSALNAESALVRNIIFNSPHESGFIFIVIQRFISPKMQQRWQFILDRKLLMAYTKKLIEQLLQQILMKRQWL